MAISRRRFIGNSAAAMVGAGLMTTLGTKAFAQSQDTLRLAFAARGVRTIDPAKSIQGADEWAIIHIHDLLVELPLGHFPENISEVQPSLAESWTMSPDAKVWTFQLRKGVQFHKGYGEMTADDVKFTFDRLRDTKEISANRVLFDNIADVKTDGPYKVTFTLSQPDPLFPIGPLSHYSASVISAKAYKEKGKEAIEKDPIGTGPYQLESVESDPSQGVKLKANADYFGGAPNIPNMQVMYIADTTARTLALLSGDVHMIEGVRSPGWVPSMQQRNSALLFDVASPGSFFTIQMNLQVKPFDDIRVRHAVAYLINRDEIAAAMSPVSQRTYGINPPSYLGGFTKDSIPEEVRYDYNPEKAKQLLGEAGFPNGFSFTADTSQREDYSSVMLIIQQQLRAGGIDMKLNIKDHTAFHADQGKGTNTMYQRSAAYPPVPTQAIIEQLSANAEVKSDGSGGPNFSHYGVAILGIDDLLGKAMDEPDLGKRIKLVQEIEVKFLSDMPLLPISDNGYLVVRSPSVDLGYELKSGYAHWRLTKAKFV
ncbi:MULTISPECIES: ABC transporter substrate-binding protein [Rhizobium]|uniref:ABC transporter substrate-binding protein n=1 Tax=Rhizobium changzhiense TaxID=2692317 RepID=A0A7Z0UHQ7_9HYPH|nr:MULTISPECIES: ABC transporter substrate-binding protein [Rhizobium]MBA5800479.1 ABC transporter substrate-binding protein [Rhizobium changzhiense]MCH4547388.1 ABC transporter substrate-binding protein [Rhizobium changzhiense]MCW0019101.1 ABC transporter substrate-binding protein [Rhizobium sp. BT-226]NNU48891.1 ABC transporter substrate-binding protein [Rhizobium changzhiense]NZD66033.1 ABC transporter substrate-binding protein [Rhizobium changzhiense]